MGRSWLLVRATVATLALWSMMGCLGDVELVMPPVAATGSFTLTFVPQPEDVGTAAALEWEGGISELRVTIAPRDSSSAPREFLTSASGSLTIPDLASGEYLIDSRRWLSDSERARLPVRDDANGFVYRSFVQAQPGGSAILVVPASRRKSLVISEWAFNPSGRGYQFGGFLELHNNADTTIYLDGILVARGFDVAHDYPNFPCTLYQHVTSDSTSIWTRLIQIFPGSGRDFPLAPGASIVVATDAIDHRSLYAEGLDLRGAAFEFIGQPDVDNPAVPNMIDQGIISSEHGLKWDALAAVAVLVAPVDIASLPRGRPRPESSTDWIRLPRARILDVLWIRSNYTGSEYPECPMLVHPKFDRAGADMRGTNANVEAEFSLSRRSVPGGSTTAKVLQHTRTGQTDFIRTARTPGTVQ